MVTHVYRERAGTPASHLKTNRCPVWAGSRRGPVSCSSGTG